LLHLALLRPLVCPATGREPEKSMEVRFLAPGSLVSNLDFVESIFGNGGDPSLPENDAAWTLSIGPDTPAASCWPSLVGIPKRELGLPHIGEATDRQKRDGMCWSIEDEPYNGGLPFKVTCRDRRGVMVTVIADNYYGYCKKEVKTQISFAANLFGLCEEEHAGGALAFATYVIGQEFYANRTVSLKQASFAGAMQLLDGMVERRPEGYAVDRRFPDIYYLPEDAEFRVVQGPSVAARWPHREHSPARAGGVLPANGYRVRLDKQQGGAVWRLVEPGRATSVTNPVPFREAGSPKFPNPSPAPSEGPRLCEGLPSRHGPGGRNLQHGFLRHLPQPPAGRTNAAAILSFERSLGSVIQLLSPSSEYTDRHNQFVRGLPQTIRQLVFTVKRYYQPEWGGNWREHFTVDSINGFLGHELKYNNYKLVSNYLRVGMSPTAPGEFTN